MHGHVMAHLKYLKVFAAFVCVCKSCFFFTFRYSLEQLFYHECANPSTSKKNSSNEKESNDQKTGKGMLKDFTSLQVEKNCRSVGIQIRGQTTWQFMRTRLYKLGCYCCYCCCFSRHQRH